MPNRSSKKPTKKRAPDTQQLARKVLDAVVPDAEPPKAKKPARPVKKVDAAAVDRAASEGMAQPQGLRPKKAKPKKKNPAAVALGRLGGLKGGKARAEKLTPAKRAEIAKKAAAKRWGHSEASGSGSLGGASG